MAESTFKIWYLVSVVERVKSAVCTFKTSIRAMLLPIIPQRTVTHLAVDKLRSGIHPKTTNS